MVTDLPKPPRFFVPDSAPSALPDAVSEPRALDQFRYHDETWAVVTDPAGTLRALRSEDCRGFGAEIARTLNAHELAGPLRGLRCHGVWLFALRRLEPGLQVPGIDDPVEVSGTLFGPFPCEAPQAWRGRLATTRAELLEGLVRGSWHPFRFRSPDAGEHSITSALLSGDDSDEVAACRGVVLAYPQPPRHGVLGNDEAVRKLLHELLSAMHLEQREESGGALSRSQVPVPDRAALEGSLAEAGFQIQARRAVRPRPGFWGRLFPEKKELPPEGSAADFLELARLALAEVPGWPSPRALALRGAMDLSEISWSVDEPRGLELMSGQLVLQEEGVLTSPPPARPPKPTKPGRAGVVESTYRQVYFRADPAFALRTTRMSFEYEYLDVGRDESASISANFDAAGDPHRYLAGPAFQGSGEWRWARAVAEGVELRRRGFLGSDLRVQFSTVAPLKLRRLIMRRLSEAPRDGAGPSPRPATPPSTTAPSAPPPAPRGAGAPEVRAAVGWEADRWERLHQCELKVEAGRLVVSATGPDPQLHGPIIEAACPVELELRMRASTGGLGEVSCQTRDHPRYELTSAGFQVLAGDDVREYRLRLYEVGVITRLRLDPCDAPGTFVIESTSLRPVPPPTLPPAPASPRVVYYDPRYTSGWGQSHASAAEQLEKAGFALVSADELAAWMQVRLGGAAPGSVCVLAVDTLPDTVFESGRPECTARRYLDAGGRLVHAGHFPFAQRGHPNGERSWAGGYGAPNRAIPCDCQDGTADPELTEEGRAFGFTRAPPNRAQLTSVAQVTVAFTRVGRFYAASWLRTFAPEHPGSGLLRFSNEGLDGRDTARVEELGRVALHGLPPARPG